MARELPRPFIVATPNDGGGIDARTVRVDLPEGQQRRDLPVRLTPVLLTVTNGSRPLSPPATRTRIVHARGRSSEGAIKGAICHPS
jgi:hypothetical protein